MQKKIRITFMLSSNMQSWAGGKKTIYEYRVSQNLTTDDFLYLSRLLSCFHVWYDHEIVGNDLQANCSVIRSAHGVPDVLCFHDLLKYGECPLYLPPEGIERSIFPPEIDPNPAVHCQPFRSDAPPPVGVNNGKRMCILKHIIIDV